MKQRYGEMTVLSGAYPETYFAGANTDEGFVSLYGSMIEEEKLTRVYILKGGSGTGKSTLMKSCAAAARAKGAEVTMLLCASDPSSADAVIFRGNGGSAAIVDGTSPHMTDPALPGAVGQIVNLGDFWRAEDLRHARAEITSHSAQKKEAYSRAYRYLSAYGEITAAARHLLKGCILTGKMEAAAKRLVSAFPAGDRYRETVRCTASVSMTGAYRLDTFSRMAKKVYAVLDAYGCGAFFLDAVRRAAADRRCPLWYAPAPGEWQTPYELYLPLPGAAVCVVRDRAGSAGMAAEGESTCAVVNMQRFLDRRALAACRMRLRFADRCREMLTEGALQSLSEARQHHFALEEIYRSAMDFDSLSLYAGKMEREILEILS